MDAFRAEWARCGPWIDAALDHCGRTHDLEDVREMVEQREARFWAGTAAAMITQINELPRFKALHLWLAGGDMREIVQHLVPLAEAWAAQVHQCTRVTLIGRFGWERALRAGGYVPAASVLMKEL